MDNALICVGGVEGVNAAYKAKAEEINVNRSAVYQKLNGVEPQVSAALLRETAAELGQLIQRLFKQPLTMMMLIHLR